MNQKNKNEESRDLHSIFRSQIVQKYPPQINYSKPIFLQQAMHEQKPQHDFLDIFMRQNEIVEEYLHKQQQPKRRSMMNFQNLMASQSDHNEVPSRNSSLSSKENNLDFHNKSFDKLPNLNVGLSKKFSDDSMGMDIQQPVYNYKHINKPMMNFNIPQSPISNNNKLDVLSKQREKQRSQKISKIQQVGCNCRKSKCLKMYCECFHLQIFCSQNCNCVDCGNSQPNQGHQQAVIDALTRNPKAFQQQKPAIQNSFNLGVQLAEVKKGCKCKKTKCLKKYCECYNSGSKCGLFCKCQSCQNN